MALDFTRSLEDLLGGSLTDTYIGGGADDRLIETSALQDMAPEDASVVGQDPDTGDDLKDVSDVVVTPEDMSNQSIAAVDDAATVERALITVRLTYEHADALALEAGNEEAKSGLFKKVGTFLAAAWKKLIETVTKWVGMLMNFVRKGGIAQKLKYISEHKNEIKKAGDALDKIMIPSPQTIKAIADGKVDSKGAKVAGKPATEYKNSVMTQSENVSLKTELGGALDLAKNTSAFNVFVTGGKDVIANAKKKLAEKDPGKGTGEENEKQKARLTERQDEYRNDERAALAEYNAYYFLLVRGFSWFITVVNALVRAGKVGEAQDKK